MAVGASEEAGGSSGEGEEPLTIRPAPAAPPAAQVARVLLGQPRAAGLLAGGEGHPTRRRNGGWRAELAGGVIGVEEVDALVPCSEGTEAARVGRGGTVEGPVGLEGGKARVAKAGAATVGPARRVGPARGRGWGRGGREARPAQGGGRQRAGTAAVELRLGRGRGVSRRKSGGSGRSRRAVGHKPVRLPLVRRVGGAVCSLSFAGCTHKRLGRGWAPYGLSHPGSHTLLSTGEGSRGAPDWPPR